MANFRDTQFVLQKTSNPQNKRSGVQETCTEMYGAVDNWITVSSHSFFLELLRVNTLQNEQKDAKLLVIYSINVWKLWKIMTVPKFKIWLMKKFELALVTHSDTGGHFAEQSARRNCLVTG